MISEVQKQALYACAREAWNHGESMLKSFSGVDQVDSEAYFCERNIYVAIADGLSLEEAFAIQDKRWRAYAEAQAAKVNAAPKINRGPMSGQSVISHRWVDPDKLQSRRAHIQFMVDKALT